VVNLARAVNSKRKLLFAATAIAIISLAVLLAEARSLYEVQDKGNIAPYESGKVYKLRVLDRFTVYADEETRPEADTPSSAALVAATTMTLMTVLLLNKTGGAPRVRHFYTFATLGLAYLAVDDIFGMHETIGHNMQFLADVPGVERPDDLIFALYTIPTAIFVWRFRDVLLAHRQAVRLFAVGGALFMVSVAADLMGTPVDETTEILTAACLLAGFVIMTAAVLSQQLSLGAFPGPGTHRRT
jgi:hypothetical protein